MKTEIIIDGVTYRRYESKKPVFVNEYGSEFYEGDYFWFIINGDIFKSARGLRDREDAISTSPYGIFESKKECYKYLMETCHE